MTKENERSIALVTRDPALVKAMKAAFPGADASRLITIEKSVHQLSGELHNSDPQVAVVDVKATRLEEIAALQQLVRKLQGRIPIIVVTEEFDTAAIRMFIQMQIADFLAKPIAMADLLRACNRAMNRQGVDDGAREPEIITFMPAAGGVGSTTLALQTAAILNRSSESERCTCVVDLNFQQGACAEYLDLEPHFDISEIEKNPDRLDWNLLDVMLSRHSSGLCVLAAPVRPMEMRNFDTDIVVRLLDLVAAYFDNVVIDLPRTWFPWTKTILLGSNRLFIVSEMTVPCLRQTQRLIEAVELTVGREVLPRVIVNRVDERSKSGLKKTDLHDVLGDNLAGCVTNNYKLVREAVDRGVLLEAIDRSSDVLRDLRAIIEPRAVENVAPKLFNLSLPSLFRKVV
jgi:pilus assembly protein CpaE